VGFSWGRRGKDGGGGGIGEDASSRGLPDLTRARAGRSVWLGFCVRETLVSGKSATSGSLPQAALCSQIKDLTPKALCAAARNGAGINCTDRCLNGERARPLAPAIMISKTEEEIKICGEMPLLVAF